MSKLQYALVADNLTGGYHDRQIIMSLHLEIKDGEWLALIGANGSGKSTLLKLLHRVLEPTAGTIWLDGIAINHRPYHWIAQKIACLPQQNQAPPGFTVRELVSLGRAPYQSWWQYHLTNQDRQAVTEALQLTGLQHYGDRQMADLSGGERQRAFLALALTQQPQVLLLDEPTTYLDIRYQLELLELLKILHRERGLTIVTVLHEINLALRYSDRIGVMKNGELLTIGTPAVVVTPANLELAFGIKAVLMDTPVGLQICPLAQDFQHASFY